MKWDGPKGKILPAHPETLITCASLHSKNRNYNFKNRKNSGAKKARILIPKNCFSLISRGAFLSMTCPVCNQETELKEAEYCLAHQRAFENLMQAFEKWDVAYGNLTLPKYLQRVQKVPGIGPKAKEIARFLFENPSRWK
jgi:hypothetical protein